MNLKLWLLLCSSLTVLAGATLSPSLPAMAQVFSDIHNASLWVKLSVAAPGLAVALSAFYFGKILDGHSKIKILYACLAAYGVFGCAGYFLHDNLWIIIATRVALGFAVAGVMVAVTTIAMDYFSGEGFNKYMGMQAAFGSFGAVVFLFVSGAISSFDWRYPFLLHLLGLFLLLVSVFIKYPPALPKETSPKNSEDIGNVRNGELPEKALLILFGLLGFFEMLVLYVIPLNLPFYLNRHFAMNEGMIGAVLSVFFLLVAFVSFNYSFFAKTLSSLKIHLSALTMIATGFTLLLLFKFLPLQGLAFCLLAIGFGLLRPNLIVWLFSFYGYSVRGRVMGFVTMGFFMGQFVSPFVIQLAERWGGERGILVAGVSLSVLMMALAYLVHLRLTRSPGETPKYFLNAKEKLEA